MASFLVACRRREDMDNGRHSPAALGGGKGGRKDSLVGTLLENLKDSWNEWSAGLRDGQDLIVGFLGTWRMVKEAHIVSVGVRKRYRGQGIGELLLRGAIEQAKALGAEVVTLEVRPSNQVAISLYKKYGFTERGLRKGYYADNREDALIMTTDHIHLHHTETCSDDSNVSTSDAGARLNSNSSNPVHGGRSGSFTTYHALQ